MGRRAAATAAALACLVLTACSATGGAPRTTQEGEGAAGTVDTPRLVVAMVSHGAPGDTFWDLVRKGAEDAARKNNIELRYSSDPQAPNQENLVRTAIDAHVDGLAVTMPNPDAIGPAARAAAEAGIPTVGLNAGMDRYRDFGLTAFFGQEERVAGTQAGQRLREEGARRVLCVIHEQGNSSQEERCAGVKEGTRDAEVETLYVNGMDLTSVHSTIQAKLAQDKGIDWVMGLVAPVALTASDAAKAAGSSAKIATFDTNAELVPAIREGNIQFAVDQQPYLQGYMAVDALWLAHRNGSTVGGGRPVYTGPSFVDATNIDEIAQVAQRGLR
ncbi:substrate-binding domain-containing protein [Corynebacterium sp. zg-331]|uniref:substrate-binding domain-containing protein n=1 Tax=unclassified Corynebacterium TaxID=2624378 RepID=UPI00128C3CD9|nr:MULTISPECIES: substrate-binding domain-containing protein [unclassified Corynebacterium]MBC3186469.1 substrate-binding domain-containing protein [Corynebacterium sp. zg-331]MPV52954.1 substrate-binding domain-containing protein [Corynebacterium sp. zg331]